MSKTFKKFLTFLLVLVMLFSVSASTVAAATAASDPAANTGATGATGTTGSGANTNTNTNANTGGTTGSYILDWASIVYNGNDVIITLNPKNASDVLSTGRDDIESLLRFALQAAKDVVFDDFADALVGENPSSDYVERTKVTYENALHYYIVDKYGEDGKSFEQMYREFAHDILTDDPDNEYDGDAVAQDYAEFVGELIKASNITRLFISTDYPSVDTLHTAIESIISNMQNGIVLEVQQSLGLTDAELNAKIAAIEDIVLAEYEEVYKALKNGECGPEKFMQLLPLIKGIKVDDILVYGDTENANGVFVQESIVALAKTLPSFADIAAMDSDAMQLTYSFALDTAMGESEFTVTFKLESKQEDVKYIAGVLADHIVITYDDTNPGYDVDIQLDVPEKFAELALRACKTGRVPDDIKNLVFTGFTKDGEDLYALINEKATFENLLKVFDYVDIDQLLTRDEIQRIIGRFEQLDGLTEAQIKAKVEQYEYRFNQAMNVFKAVYARIPAIYKNVSISTFYDGDGKFSAEQGVEFDIVDVIMSVGSEAPDISSTDIIEKIRSFSPALADRIVSLVGNIEIDAETIANLVAGFLDDTSVSLYASVGIQFNGIHRVQYCVGQGEVVRSGFLPTGANLAFFSNMGHVDGQPIVKWIDAYDGQEYTTMPDRDITLLAQTVSATAELSASAESITYGDGEITLTASVSSYNPRYTYELTWYNDLVPVATTTNTFTYTVSEVAQSGHYYVKIKVSDNSAELQNLVTNEVEVAVNKLTVDLNDAIEWNYDGPFTYAPDTEWSVSVAIKSEYASLLQFAEYSADTLLVASNAGDYVVSATYILLDDNNYAFANGNTFTRAWVIKPIEYNRSDIIDAIDMSELQQLVYAYAKKYGVDFVAKLIAENVPEQLTVVIGDEIVRYDEQSGTYVLYNHIYRGTTTGAGTYKTPITVTVKEEYEGNYVWTPDATVYSDAWTIAKQQIDLSDSTKYNWVNYNQIVSRSGTSSVGDFTYSPDTIFGVKIGNLPGDIDEAVDYTNNTSENATNGVLNATASIDFDENAQLLNDYDMPTEEVNGEIKIKTFAEPTKQWKVEKAVLDYSSLQWISDTYTYNGAPQGPDVSEFDDDELNVVITYFDENDVALAGKPTDAGRYYAEIFIEAQDTTNYDVIENIQKRLPFSIAKQQINVDLYWKDSEGTVYVDGLFTYEENTEYKLTLDIDSAIQGYIDDGVLILVGGESDTYTNAGTGYAANATVTLSPVHTNNYEIKLGGSVVAAGTVDYSITWSVAQKQINISGFVAKWETPAGIEYSDTLFVYSEGQTYTIRIDESALDSKLYVEYGGTCSESNANSLPYVATATIKIKTDYTGNYTLGNQTTEYTKEWYIGYANLSELLESEGVRFEDDTDANGAIVIIYDGNPHEIKIDETLLPDIALVDSYEYYDADGNLLDVEALTEKGAYTVVANIISANPNYTDATMTVTVVIRDARKSFAWGDIVLVDVLGDELEEGAELDVVDELANYSNLDLSAFAGEGEVAKLVAIYDVEFVKDGADLDLNNSFEVRILIPAASQSTENATFKIVYVNEQGAPEEIDATRVGNYVSFNTTHFSVYGIVEVTEDQTVPPVCPGHVDNDGDNKCDNCGEDMSTECPGHVDNNGDNKCDNCGADMTPADDHDHNDADGDGKCDNCGCTMEDKKDWTWLWILIAVLLIIIILLLIIIILKRRGGEEEPKEEDETEPEPEVEITEVLVVEEEPAVEEPVVEEPVVEEPVVEEPVVEEPVVEEPVVEEPVVEEPVVEEPVVEEPKVEEPAPAPAPGFFASIAAASDADAVRLVNGVVVPVRYRTSFMSRLIQAEPPIQDYYTVVKNYLLSYKGVKARTSWNFESFNKGRIQCAKLNVKGNAFQVYLGLEPSEYNVEKYHFVDVSDKPKLDKVPMMLKVKSDRSLKYALELVDEVMSKNGIEQGELPNEDYHMPYESTEALVDRDLVKVILPDGMVIDENTIIERVNVGDLLSEFKTEDDSVKEEPKVEEPVAEEPVVEEPVVEEPVVEEPVVEEPVAEEPVVEEPKVVHIVDHHVAEEEIVNVDAVEADEIITDEQAGELVETITRTPGFKPKSNKCHEINLDTICENYENGDTVTIDNLKAKSLVTKKAERIKVLARGVMTKRLTVVADKFSIQAIKMIGLAGGLAQKYKD